MNTTAKLILQQIGTINHISTRFHIPLIIIALFAIFENSVFSADVKVVQFSTNGWHQFRGPRRDGICDETGLLQKWKDGEPGLIWTATNLGNGYSAPVFDRERLFITGDVGDDLVIFALNLQGKTIWETTNGASWKGPYPGSRSACAFSEGNIYHLNAHGRLACFNSNDGKEIWAMNILEKFDGKEITWGLSECVLVDEKYVYATAGGSRGLMVALNKTNGSVVWASPPLKLGETRLPEHERVAEPAGEVDSASYSSPIMFSIGSKRYIVGCSMRHIFIIDASNGNLVCTRPLPTRYQVIASMPVLIEDSIFFTAPDAGGGALYKIEPQSDYVILKKLWRTPLDTCHGGIVLTKEGLCGSYYRGRTGWALVSRQDGSVRFHLKEIPMGSILYADGRLYCLSQEGDMTLIEPGPDSLKIISKFRLVEGRRTDVWAHPVIYKKRLYLRYHQTLYCYDIADNNR